MDVRMVGPWPPAKGVSLYCYQLATAVSRVTRIEFTPLSAIYPGPIYPGRSTQMEPFSGEVLRGSELTLRGGVSYRNPASWFAAGLQREEGLIHLHWWTPYLAYMYIPMLSIAKRRRVHTVLTLHNIVPHESRKVDRVATLPVLRLTDQYIVHSQRNRLEAIALHGLQPDTVHVIPHGPLTVLRQWSGTRKEARRALGIQGEAKVILFFGNVRPYKGLDTLLAAFRLARRELENVVLVLAGEIWKGEEGWISTIPKDMKPDIKIYPRFVPTTLAGIFFEACDLVVLPYKKLHGQSGVAAAAHAFGKPLLVTDVGGLSEMVRDELAVARPNDPEDLAQRISTIMGDSDILNRLSEDSLSCARDFSWDKIAQMTVELYESCMQSRGEQRWS